ncbi:unnamed protein product, partial [Musa banksii]
ALRLTAPSASLCIGSSVAHLPLFRDLLQPVTCEKIACLRSEEGVGTYVIKSDYYDDPLDIRGHHRQGRVVLRRHPRSGLRDRQSSSSASTRGARRAAPATGRGRQTSTPQSQTWSGRTPKRNSRSCSSTSRPTASGGRAPSMVTTRVWPFSKSAFHGLH